MAKAEASPKPINQDEIGAKKGAEPQRERKAPPSSPAGPAQLASELHDADNGDDGAATPVKSITWRRPARAKHN